MSGLAEVSSMGLLLLINPNTIATYWFVLPLVVAMSCVYSASRYESWAKISSQSFRLAGMILGILFVAMALLLLVNTQV